MNDQWICKTHLLTNNKRNGKCFLSLWTFIILLFILLSWVSYIVLFGFFFASVQSEQSYNPIWNHLDCCAVNSPNTTLTEPNNMARREKHISYIWWKSLYSRLTSNQKRIFPLCVSVQCRKALYCFYSSCIPGLPLYYPDREEHPLSWRENNVVKANSKYESTSILHINTFRERPVHIWGLVREFVIGGFTWHSFTLINVMIKQFTLTNRQQSSTL